MKNAEFPEHEILLSSFVELQSFYHILAVPMMLNMFRYKKRDREV